MTPEFMRAENEPRTDATPVALTIEFALYAALFVGAFLIRFIVLDWAPLNSTEAQQAVAAYNFVQANVSPSTGSPLLFFFTSIFFALFTASDFTARLAPAIFGTGLVLLPALFRRDVGRTGALVASAFLAFTPSLVFFSRTLDGTIPAVAASLAVVGYAARYLEARAVRDLYVLAACVALALLAAPDVWTVALALAFYFAAAKFKLVLGFENRNPESLASKTKVDGKQLEFASIIFLFIFLLVSTVFLLHRDGLGAAFDLLGAWLGSLTPGASATDFIRLLLVYEPFVTFFGISALVGLILNAKKNFSGALIALAFWAVVAFVVLGSGADNTPARVVFIVVPLALLAGASIGEWIERAARWVSMLGAQELLSHEVPILAIILGLASFLSIVLGELAQRGNILNGEAFVRIFGSLQDNPLAGMVLVFALFVFAFVGTAILALTTLGVARAQFVGMFFLLIVLSLWTIRQTAMLNFFPGHVVNAQEWIVARAASPNVHDLVRDMKDASRWRANDTRALVIAADTSLGPIVQWELRDFRYAQFSAHPSAAPGIQAVLLPMSAPPPANGWIAQKYQVEMTHGTAPFSALRELIYRDVGDLDSTDAVLWIPQPQ